MSNPAIRARSQAGMKKAIARGGWFWLYVEVRSQLQPCQVTARLSVERPRLHCLVKFGCK
ncbi:hypothetical protein [Coleofasciculus sp. FACHB-SPT9]|uniref:hypothetical protein n=1 Tax=Cyanophyceae TaxID=3028117 RepID=UPI001687629B|nr:hypothetical protein [Coleofasciculus sp. FACHB-SPT9]MBD1892217.1 hypothetical protein [Coleofasciculus sp. FACHB-SPT9]